MSARARDGRALSTSHHDEMETLADDGIPEEDLTAGKNQ
jgi:hypothetical protein